MTRLRWILALLGTVCVLLFLFANVEFLQAGVGYVYLLCAVSCAAFLVVSSADLSTTIVFRRSASFMLAFLSYFLLRLLVDVRNLGEIKAELVGTDGGVCFAYLLGAMVSVLCTPLYARRGIRGAQLSAFVVSTVTCGLAAKAFLAHASSISLEHFGIQDQASLYQRPGNFMIVAALIGSVYTAQAFRCCAAGRGRPLVSAALVLAYFGSIVIELVTSQLVGSNTGFAMVAGLALGTSVWLLRPNLVEFKWARALALRGADAVSLFVKSLPRLVLWGAASLVAGVVAGAMVLTYTGLRISQLRIFGYQNRNIAYSLIGRIEILKSDFLTQWAYSPIFGNVAVDDLTTGRGTYAHSLLSVLTHLGLVGTVLLLAYFASLYAELRRPPGLFSGFPPLYRDPELGQLRLILAVIFVVFALLATFFTWLPLWAAFGFLFPPLVLRRAVPGRLRRLAAVEFELDAGRVGRQI